MNRKQRNLQFIRTKNNLRRGIVSFYLYQKISKEIELNKNFLKLIQNSAIKSLKKNYNLDFHKYVDSSINYKTGLSGSDFVENTMHISVKINLVSRINR